MAMQSFRRGIDRRAYVLARAQCGNTDLVYQALIAVDEAFNQEANALPIAQWPIRFWTLLLSRKELTQGSSPWQALASISHGSRAALLLRLVGGLDFSHAAQVLGISEETYRFALQRGLEQLQTNGHSMAELERLRDDFFDEVKQLSHEQLTTNIQQANRHAASISDTKPEYETNSGKQVSEDLPKRLIKTPKTWWRRWLWMLLTLMVVAVAAVAFYRYQQHQRELEALVIQARATEADKQAGDLLVHADYDLIAAGDALQSAQEINFYSWLAAGAVPEVRLEAEAKPDTLLQSNADHTEQAHETLEQE
jgi:Sigma-70, region 4